jgi:hypothetical protein
MDYKVIPGTYAAHHAWVVCGECDERTYLDDFYYDQDHDGTVQKIDCQHCNARMEVAVQVEIEKSVYFKTIRTLVPIDEEELRQQEEWGA